MVIVWELVYGLLKSDFRISFSESYHVSSSFAEYRYYTNFPNFKWPYFRTAGGYGHMVGHAGPIRIAHIDVALTWSNVKVKVTDLLKFRKLHFSTSTFMARRSQLMGDYEARFLSCSPRWRSRDTKVREMLLSPESTAFISALVEARTLLLWLQVGRNKTCTVRFAQRSCTAFVRQRKWRR